MSSVTRDVKAVRANSASTAKELRDFLGQLKGKSPGEMLGLVAQSSLVQSTINASVLMVVLILVLTIIPFGVSKMKSSGAAAGKETPAAANNAPATSEPKAAPVAGKTPDSTPGGEPTTAKPTLEDTLGIGDALEAPADKNPLESKADDLFKDLE